MIEGDSEREEEGARTWDSDTWAPSFGDRAYRMVIRLQRGIEIGAPGTWAAEG